MSLCSTRKYRRMTFTDRLMIEKMFNAGCSYRTMSKRLGFAVSSLHYEIKRGLHDALDWKTYRTVKRYSATIADDDASFQATSKGGILKLGKRFDYAKEVAQRIKDGQSPDVIVGLLRKEHRWTVSTVTLYRYIDQGYIPGITNKNLIDKPKRKKRDHRKPKPIRPPKGMSIEHRPKEINQRLTFGHWEMDSVIGHKSGDGESILVLTERKTRYEIILKLPTKAASSVTTALRNLIPQYPQGTFQTITVDNGSEFADYQTMKTLVQEVYYCHPFCSGERGSNENANRLIRRFLPKFQSMKQVTQRECDAIAHAINSMHRKILGYQTAQEAFDLALSTL